MDFRVECSAELLIAKRVRILGIRVLTAVGPRYRTEFLLNSATPCEFDRPGGPS